jgi:hypothetical protein
MAAMAATVATVATVAMVAMAATATPASPAAIAATATAVDIIGDKDDEYQHNAHFSKKIMEKISMKYSFFVNDTGLSSCRRPQYVGGCIKFF